MELAILKNQREEEKGENYKTNGDEAIDTDTETMGAYRSLNEEAITDEKDEASKKSNDPG